ncbi:MAG: hypothetical protein RLZZ148_246 [Cyanobacteriota bacterium]
MKLLTASLLVAAGGFVVLGTTTYARAATMVDLELAFVIDGSSSTGPTAFEANNLAYYNIFTNNFYRDVVQPLAGKELAPGQIGTGKIAVAAYQFGQRLGIPTASPASPNACNNDPVTGREQCQAVDWTIIASQADANAFADKILNLLKIGGGTPLGAGIRQATFGSQAFPNYDMPGIINNDIDSIRRIFDLASDGIFSPAGVPPELALVDPEIAARQAYDPSYCDPEDDSDPIFCNPSSIYSPDQGFEVLNIIGNPDGTPRPLENQDRIDSLLEAFQGATNLNGTPGRLFNPQTLGNPYQEVLNEKILQETQTPPVPPVSTPESSLALGLLSLGLLGIGSKLIQR